MPGLLGSPALEFKSLDGREALGELFEYTVRLQTPDSPILTDYVTANMPVKQLIGKEFGIRIVLPRVDEVQVQIPHDRTAVNVLVNYQPQRT